MLLIENETLQSIWVVIQTSQHVIYLLPWTPPTQTGV